MDIDDLRHWFRSRIRADLFLAFNLTQTLVTVLGALILLLFMLQAAPVLRYYPLDVFIRGTVIGLVGGAISLAVNGRYLLALRRLQVAVSGRGRLTPETLQLVARMNYALPVRLLVITMFLWPTLPLLLGIWFRASRIINLEDAIRLGMSGILYAPIQGLILFYFARLVLRRLGRLTQMARIELPEESRRGWFGLRAKLSMSYACLAIIPLLTGMLINDVRREKREMDENLTRVCEALDRVHAKATSVTPDNWDAAVSDPVIKASIPQGTSFQVTDPSGYILHGALSLDARMDWTRLLNRRSGICAWRPVPGGTDFLVTRYYSKPGVWVGAETQPIPPRPSLLRSYGDGLVLAALVMALGITIALLAAEDVTAPVSELSRVAARAEHGEYLAVTGVIMDDELGQLASGYNRLVISVREALRRAEEMLGKARVVSEGLAEQAERIRGMVDRNREVINEQSSLSVEAAGGAEQVTRAALEIKERAHQTSSQMDEAAESCRVSSQTVTEVTRGMEGVVQASDDLGHEMEILEENYRRMEEVVRIIDDIAERTEMLGLNAALEVGREEGRGGRFAVVALEVQRLSERISQETSGIKRLFGEIRRSSMDMAQTIEIARARAGEMPEWLTRLAGSIRSIERRSNGASDSMREIVHMTDQQSQALEQMKVMVAEIQSVATVMDEVSQGAESTMDNLNQLAADLRKLLH